MLELSEGNFSLTACHSGAEMLSIEATPAIFRGISTDAAARMTQLRRLDLSATIIPMAK